MSDQRSNNDLILDALIDAERKRFPTSLKESEFFEIFSAQQLLKNNDLSDSEIIKGIVGNGGDGGIDSLYFFIQGKLIQEDILNYDVWGKDLDLDLYIVQSKTSRGFGEDAIRKFIDVTEDIFSMGNNLKDKQFTSRYDSRLLEAAERFKNAYLSLVARNVRLTFHYVYASRGEVVDQKVNGLTLKLEKKVRSLFPDAIFDFQFLGADKLAHIAGKARQTKKEILYSGPVINPRPDSFVFLVKMKDFYQFLRDEVTGTINRHIFEANVRDYQGDIGVNKEIRETLANPSGENFWWLNNGITILTSSVLPKGNIGYILESPEIVNGLQTSNEIFNYFSGAPNEKIVTDDREILIRLIVPSDDPTRNKIIKATNSQTKIPPFALKATDPVQWKIEQFLLPKGLYYDRRKNYYKNQGQPQAKIVTIIELAQAVLAIKLARPNDARARPGGILDDENEYRQVFSDQIPLELYYALLKIMESVDDYLANSTLIPNEKTNLRFYLAYYVVCKGVGRAKLNQENIIEASTVITEELLDEALPVIQKFYKAAGGDDNAAKGSSFIEAIDLDLIKHFLPSALPAAKKRLAAKKTQVKKKAPKKKVSAKKVATPKVTTKSKVSNEAKKSGTQKSTKEVSVPRKSITKGVKNVVEKDLKVQKNLANANKVVEKKSLKKSKSR